MEYGVMGRTGMEIPRLVLGTMNFGYQLDEEAAIAILDRALSLGFTFIDTADMYPTGGPADLYGTTEEFLGRWIARAGVRRDELVIATKFYYTTGPARWHHGGSRTNVVRSCEASLRRLNTDYIDLYQMHAWDSQTPIEETLGALADLRNQGKIRYAGICNVQAWQLARSLGYSENGGLPRFDVVQPRYNLLFRSFERDLLPCCAQEGIAVIPYNPLAGGLLTGKHQSGDPLPGSRFTLPSSAEEYRERYWSEDKFRTINLLATIADESGMTLYELALRWLLSRPAVSSPIIGASAPAHVEAAAAAERLGPLEPELVRSIDSITACHMHSDLIE